MDDKYKAAILRVVTPAPKIPLAEAPAPEFDLGVALICPSCGGMDSLLKEGEEVEVASCPDCGCSFTPQLESLSRKIIQSVNERRLRQRRAVNRLAHDMEKREAIRLLGV